MKATPRTYPALIASFLAITSVSCLTSEESASASVLQNRTVSEKRVNNPIIADLGVCDPHIHIFEGKAYLFATHDEAPGNTEYTMHDWWLWSSPDLVHWEKEFTLNPKDTYIDGPWPKCYAPEGATRNGKYYFYYSQWSLATGVAVSDEPEGPYVDPLGEPFSDLWDPTIYIDDDENQTPYLIAGEYPYEIVELNEDMVSFKGEPQEITHIGDPWTGDGNYVHKRNGIYYLNGHNSVYGTSTDVRGPYTYRGKFYPGWTDHATFFSWNNQDFCTFGTGDTDGFFRKTIITYAYYRDNGELVIDVEIARSPVGVGQYESGNTIQAEWYFAASDGLRTRENESGFEIRQISDGAYLNYPNLKGLAENTTVEFLLASNNPAGAVIEIRADGPKGTLLGECKVPNTGSWTNYKTVEAKLNNPVGTHNIYLVFKGQGDELLRLDSFYPRAKFDKKDWTATASHASVDPANAIDGAYSTRWDSAAFQKSGMWFQVDLGAPLVFNTIKLDSTASSKDGPVAYELYLSNNGTDWGQPIALGKGESITQIKFPRQTARFIKIVQTASSEVSYWSIHELSVSDQAL